MDTCAVCFEDVQNGAWRLPGCGHAFHPVCVLNFAQFDTRCPVCRHREDGVTQAVVTPRLVVQISDVRALWRRYAARRRRLLQHNPDVRNDFERLRGLRGDLFNETTRLKRLFDARCRDVWRCDSEVASIRRNISRLRRRELRLERSIGTFLQEHLGPEP